MVSPNTGHTDDVPRTLRELFERGQRRQARSGSALMLQGDPGSTVALVISGRVKVVYTEPSGDQTLLAVLGPDEYVGDFEALGAAMEPRAASVIALDAVTVLTVAATEYAAFLHTNPAAAIERLRAVRLRLARADRRRIEWASMNATTRLAAVLAELTEMDTQDGADIRGLTQRDLATLVGMSEDSISRALHELRRRSLLKTSRRRFYVISRARLNAFVHGTID